jgi:hypothetical protein
VILLLIGASLAAITAAIDAKRGVFPWYAFGWFVGAIAGIGYAVNG